ncbi:MAG: VCBS repeat-containing protein, partial [Lentisphaeria bacterium]|nr:VCBS repeat-containing protein [Lentisphaeria bacterium]
MRRSLQCLIGIVLMQVPATNSPGTFIDKSTELGFTGTAGRWAVAWADYNNDGYVDLYDGFTWKNNEGKGFVKLAHPHRSTGIFADYDNDGFLDLFISDSPASLALYRNISGTGEFTKQEMAAMPMDCSMCLAWADLNGDGYVDLYVGGGNPGAQTDAVFMSHGGNFFTAERFGGNLYTRGVNACDYDEDHDMDVLASRYWFQANQLWQNDGAGNLTDVGAAAGVHGAGHTISAAFADMDNDGHFDLFACNFNHHDNRRSEDAILYKNMGPGGSWQFDRRFTFDGGNWQESYASCALADYDNDGDV